MRSGDHSCVLPGMGRCRVLGLSASTDTMNFQHQSVTMQPYLYMTPTSSATFSKASPICSSSSVTFPISRAQSYDLPREFRHILQTYADTITGSKNRPVRFASLTSALLLGIAIFSDAKTFQSEIEDVAVHIARARTFPCTLVRSQTACGCSSARKRPPET